MKVNSSFVASMLAATTLASSQDGLWTGHDWTNPEYEVQDVDGSVLSLDASMMQRMNSTRTLDDVILEDVYSSQANVQMVQSVLSEERWDYFFPQANALYDYQSFLMAAAKYPAFCNEGDADLCKRELATFFAMTTHEVGQENPSSSLPMWRQGFYYITEKACTAPYGGSTCDYKSESTVWPPVSNVQYFGRGPFQLSWNYNYGAFSTVLDGDITTLLEDPDKVATNGYTAFVSAMWFYMSPSVPKPSMHEIATKLYVPNASDKAAGLGAIFGSATMIINGGLECTTESGDENSNSEKRIEYYQEFLSQFGLPAETGLGCATMDPFDDASSSNYPQSLDKNWAVTDACKVVPYFTQFSILRNDDYKRCVCYNWAPDLANCLDGALPNEEAPEILQI